MEYLLAFLAFIATVVGVVGKTWKSGRPTLVGWIAGSVALLVLVLSVVQHYRREQEQKKIAEIAYLKVLRSVHGLLEPFAILLADIDLRKKQPGTGPTELNQQLFRFANATEADLRSEQMVSVFKLLPQLSNHFDDLKYNPAAWRSYALEGRPTVLNRTRTWREVFRNSALPALNELDRTIGAYQSVMNSKSVTSAERLRGAWLVQRIARLPETGTDEPLLNFFHLDDRKPDMKIFFYEDFLQTAEAAWRAALDELRATR